MTALHITLSARLRRDNGAPAVLNGPSYAELAAMVARMQDLLKRKDVTALGVLSTRKLEAYVAVLAAFFSGIPFVPLNPELPVERLEMIISSGGVGLVAYDPSTQALAQSIGTPSYDISASLPGEIGAVPQTARTKPGATAYQMFTSGSTGAPKGVPISYANLSHYVTAISAHLDLPEGARFSQLFDLSFDLSLHDIFVGLSRSGILCPASKMDLMMPHAYLAKAVIDIWFSVPMLANGAVRGLAGKPAPHKLQMALFCGEALPSQFAIDFGAFLKEDALLYNLYGPTEATIAHTAKLFSVGQGHLASVPLGRPFGENIIAVETDAGQIQRVEAGVEGQLLLGGPQIFDGYDPDIGAECFVHEKGTLYYRSGDLVRVDDAGELLHLGRTDNQIKLRGYRIELGDIEAMGRKVFDLPVTAAVVLGEGEQSQIGLAYEAQTPLPDISLLKPHLPAYMMPTRWLRLDTMPLNVNGKIDRKILRLMSWPD